MFCSQSRKYILELRDVRFAVIGRQLHADQQDSGVSLIDLFQNDAEIVFDFCRAKTAQAVVGAEFHDHDRGMVLFQQQGDALASAQRGFPADAGVEHLETGAATIELKLQQVRPAFGDLKAETCR